MKSNTSEQLKLLMQEYGYKQVDILEKCKPYSEQFGIRMGRNDISQYVSGKVQPKQDKLTILGLALNVSEAWLMGYDVPRERKSQSSDNNADTHQDEKKLLKMFGELSPANQKEVLQIIQLKLQNQEEPAARRKAV